MKVTENYTADLILSPPSTLSIVDSSYVSFQLDDVFIDFIL